MIGSKEDLYSIDDAKALSLHLSGAKKKTDSEDGSRYIRFSAGTQVKPGVAHAEKTDGQIVPEQTPAMPIDPFDTWEALLKWCIDITKSTSCFVVDPQGFILMSEGDKPPEDGFEGAGANLKLALDQLPLMELDNGEVQIVDLTSQKQGILVVRAQDSEEDFFTLCFIGISVVTEAQKKVLHSQIQKSVLRLT